MLILSYGFRLLTNYVFCIELSIELLLTKMVIFVNTEINYNKKLPNTVTN